MNELRVWVDGKERIIRGVSDSTTCESILIALAKAAGKTGRVALLEKWRDLERILPRTEKPIKCLQMWGSLQKEVKFLLRDETPDQSVLDIERCPAIELVIDNKLCDPHNRLEDYRSLEATASSQASRIIRLSRANNILDTQLASWSELEEASLYSTEEEISEHLINQLQEVSKIQKGELVSLETTKEQYEIVKNSREKFIANIEDLREKLKSLENRISDLESTSEKLYSKLQSFNFSGGFTTSLAQQVDSPIDELKNLRREVEKQTTISNNQSSEISSFSRSVGDTTQMIEQRTKQIASLKMELSSRDAYYDLDEDFHSVRYDDFDDPLLDFSRSADNDVSLEHSAATKSNSNGDLASGSSFQETYIASPLCRINKGNSILHNGLSRTLNANALSDTRLPEVGYVDVSKQIYSPMAAISQARDSYSDTSNRLFKNNNLPNHLEESDGEEEGVFV